MTESSLLPFPFPWGRRGNSRRGSFPRWVWANSPKGLKKARNQLGESERNLYVRNISQG